MNRDPRPLNIAEIEVIPTTAKKICPLFSITSLVLSLQPALAVE
jgi:hypothetical protein